MRKRLFVVLLATLLCAACESALEGDLKDLAAEKAPRSSAEAEALYEKAKEFVERVAKTENAPKDLLGKAKGLARERAKNFFAEAAKDGSPGGLARATAALVGLDIDPEALAKQLGIKINLKEIEGSRDFLKSDDPKLWK